VNARGCHRKKSFRCGERLHARFPPNRLEGQKKPSADRGGRSLSTEGFREPTMPEPINYYLKHSFGMVDLVLADDRFIVNTQGSGLIDKLRTSDIPLSDLKNFCLVPTIGAQNIISRHGGEDAGFLYDRSYDSEFIFSYLDRGKLKKKRLFVNSQDDIFQTILETLQSERPEASLLDLEPAEAQRQIGVMAARKGVFIVVALLVGVPTLIVVISLIYMAATGFK